MKHAALDVKLWLLYNTKYFDTPPQSPDLNPIENLWAYLKSEVRNHNISSKTKLSSNPFYKNNGEKYQLNYVANWWNRYQNG